MIYSTSALWYLIGRQQGKQDACNTNVVQLSDLSMETFPWWFVIPGLFLLWTFVIYCIYNEKKLSKL